MILSMTTRRTPPPPGSAQAAIKQTRPFRSAGQEALVSLMLPDEAVRWPVAELLAARGAGLTLPQYNVLRILRGAGREGLPTLEIAERTIERTPGMTRMIDRLERKGLVERARSDADRRQVLCRLTDAGRRLVASLDRPVDALDEQLFAALTRAEVKELVRLLDKLRNSLRGS